MNKKVCHVTSIHKRYDTRIFEKECVSIAKNQYEVFLLVNDNLPDEIKYGVKIVSTKFQPKNRIDRFINSKKVLYAKAKQLDAELYHLHDPDLLTLGNKLIKDGKKVIFDSHEDFAEQIYEKPWIPKILRNTISKVYSEFEKKSLKNYDAVISVTPHIIRRLKTINQNSVMITNYPIIDDVITPKNGDGRTICFAGGITSLYCHHNILNAINDIDNVKYILAGTGSKEYLDCLCSIPSWKKVDYRGQVAHPEVKKIYQQSNVGMALDYSNQARVEGSLGVIKLFEFMEAGLPVICTNYKLWVDIIEKYNCGICVDPNDIKEIKNAICYLINNPDIANKMGNNGRRAVIHEFNWGNQEKVLLDLYMKLLS